MIRYNLNVKGVCIMQISAISPNFSGRRDNIDAVINMSDNDLQKIAYLQTAERFDNKKQRRVTNALFYTAPLAAGLSTALLSERSATTLFSKEISGVAGRLAKGAKVAAVWTAALAAIDLLGAIKNKISENSSEVRKFDKEHPFLSLGTMLALGLGAITLVNKGAGKLGSLKAPDVMKKYTGKAAKAINSNGIVNKAKDGLLKLSAKTPSALKDIGATMLELSPTAFLLGGLFHSISSNGAQNRDFANNYHALRNRQEKLTKARIAELSLQNDILMQDAKNREDMRIMKDNLADLPEEVKEKVAELQEEMV